ncbi:332_t:CDS:2 [Cetraspora pellucida]|uniref:332_t:CDS:1 n=1 Tax=Cetraspora pellucida TaxID=1433469 RepID=A0A9N9IQ21_9GLOM|nr:332_t:CDS:2 [Cetraspora pellucida]
MSGDTKMPLLRNGTKPDGSIHVMTYIDDKNVVRPKAKCIARLNCDYTFRGLKRAVPRALNSVNIIKICHFAHRSECFISAYKLGKAAAFAVKKYHSHRRIPEKVLKEFAHD